MLLKTLFVLAVYVLPFIVLGYAARRLLDPWMHGASLSDIRQQSGEAGPGHRRFLLGSWRNED